MRMKINNKPLFALFLLLDIIVSGAAIYLSCVRGGIVPLLFVVAFFIPLPMLWQTNIIEYKGRTRIGKRIAAESDGNFLFLLAHLLLLFIIWAICSFFVNKEDGIIALFAAGTIVVIVLISVFISSRIDSTAKRYAKLSPIEILEIIEKGNNIAAGGVAVIATNTLLVLLLLFGSLVVGLLADGLNIIPQGIYDALIDSNILMVAIYNVIAMLVGLFIFAFGWIKRGTASRALKLYVRDRELTEQEEVFIQQQSEIEKQAGSVRAKQIMGDIIPGYAGDVIKAKGTADAVPIMGEVFKQGNNGKWYVIASIVGTIIAGLIIVY